MKKNNITKLLTPRNICITICILISISYLLPILILQDLSYIRIHDNLDSVFIYYHQMVLVKKIFIFDENYLFKNIMNGLPIWCLPSNIIIVSLYNLFGSFWGYIINDIIVRIIGFIGMYLLLKRYILSEDKNEYIAIALSFCFIMIPFRTEFGLSVAGQPLLLYTILKILSNNQKIFDYFYIILFTFYSSFVLVGIFIISAIFIIIIFNAIQNKKLNYRLIICTITIFLFYCIIDYKLIYGTFIQKSFISHRVEWGFAEYNKITLLKSIVASIKLFFSSHTHPGYIKTYLIFLMFISTIIAFRKKRLQPIIYLIMGVIIVICLFHGFNGFLIFKSGVASLFPFLKTFQVDRFYFLLPLLWFILFALLLNEIRKHTNFKLIVYFSLIIQLGLITFDNREYQINLINILYRNFVPKAKIILINRPSFREYFAEKLFNDIKKYIKTPLEDYRVVSLGMHPSIAQYNGFYTLDSFLNIYSLNYKHKFRVIIENELNKHKTLKDMFDKWGCRCYLYSSELYDKCFPICSKEKNITVNNLEINTKALKELGGKYILSAVKIKKYKKLNLKFEKVFDNDESFWKIYLYKINYYEK